MIPLKKFLIFASVAMLAACLPPGAYAEEHGGDEGPPKVEHPEPGNDERPDANTSDNSNVNTNTSDGGVSDSQANNSISSRTDVTAVGYDAIDLARMPVGVCQGSSTQISAGGNAGLLGGVLGGGKSNVDRECTLRENLRVVSILAASVPELRGYVLQAVANLNGFEFLWADIDQHPKCKKWLLKGSTEAPEHNCKWPVVTGPAQLMPAQHIAAAK